MPRSREQIIAKLKKARGKAREANRKMRLVDSAQDKKIEAIEAGFAHLETQQVELNNKLIDLDDTLMAVIELITGEEIPDKPEGLPERVYNAETLRQFAKAILPDTYEKQFFGDGLKREGGKVRDALIEHYPDDFGYLPKWIEQKHDLTKQHLDAVWFKELDEVVDFISGSSAGGSLADKLQWIYVEK